MTGSRGAALVMALLALSSAALVGNVLVSRTLQVDESARRDRVRLRAFWAAEGGLAHARHALADDAGWTGGAVQVGGEKVVVAVRRSGGGWFVVARADGVRIRARVVPARPYPRVVAWDER